MKLLVLFFCLSLPMAAQQDPAYFSGMYNNLYYNFAGDNNGNGLLANACYRNQQGGEAYASHAGFINAAYLGQVKNMLHAFSFEYDHLNMSSMQYIGWSEAFNILQMKRSKLRMGLRLNAFHYRMRYDVFSERVLEIPYGTGYVFDKWTWSPDAALLWLGDGFSVGAGVRNLAAVHLNEAGFPGLYSGQTSRTFYGFAHYTVYPGRGYHKTILSLAAMHQQPQEGRLIFYDNGTGPHYNPANENRYVYYRNGDVPFSMQAMLEFEINDRLLLGVTGRGFHQSMQRAGLSVNCRLNHLFRLSALMMAPKKEQGVVVETSLNMQLPQYGRPKRARVCDGPFRDF